MLRAQTHYRRPPVPLARACPGLSRVSVQVKPDNGAMWHTIAIGRETPHVDIDRSQFPGSQRATIRVLRTAGVTEEVFAKDIVDLH